MRPNDPAADVRFVSADIASLPPEDEVFDVAPRLVARRSRETAPC